MSRIEHFGDGSTEHQKPLYNMEMGEGSPYVGTRRAIDESGQDSRSRVGPLAVGEHAATTESGKAEDMTTFTSPKTGKSYATISTGYAGSNQGVDPKTPTQGLDFGVSTYPTADKWSARTEFQQPHIGVGSIHKRTGNVQGTMFSPASVDHLESSSVVRVFSAKTNAAKPSVHVGTILTQEGHRGQGLAMHMLRTGQQYANTRGNEIVADNLRTDMGISLGRRASQEDPNIKNESGEYLSEEKPESIHRLSPIGGTSQKQVRAGAEYGGTDEVRERAAKSGKEKRAALAKTVQSRKSLQLGAFDASPHQVPISEQPQTKRAEQFRQALDNKHARNNKNAAATESAKEPRKKSRPHPGVLNI